MKIIHIIVGLDVGGAESMLARLVLSDEKSFDVTNVVVSLTGNGYFGDLFKEKGIRVYSLGIGKNRKALTAFFQLRSLIKREAPDVVQTWMYHSDLIGGLAARSVGIRNIVWGVRSTNIEMGHNRLTVALRKCCAIVSRFIPKKILCAANASREVHEAVGYDAKKMIVIPNGFDLDRIDDEKNNNTGLRRRLSIGDESVLIVSVGRFHPVKDHNTFIDMAEIVSKKTNKAKFLLIGRGLDDNNTELLEKISETGLSDRFFLLGQRRDVPACLNESDIFCLHSVSEGFPNVLGEAMYVGLPCVATDVGDAGFMLGSNEYVVKPKDADGLADLVIALIKKAEKERRYIGEVNRRRVVENFSMQKIIGRYHELYREISTS